MTTPDRECGSCIHFRPSPDSPLRGRCTIDVRQGTYSHYICANHAFKDDLAEHGHKPAGNAPAKTPPRQPISAYRGAIRFSSDVEDDV